MADEAAADRRGRHEARHRAIRRVLWLEMGLNLVVALAKAIYGWWSGSLAVSSDALHSLVDASANVVALMVMKVAAAPPDKGHPYGHHKAEIVASAVVGFAIAGVAVRFGMEAISALVRGPELPATSLAGFLVVGATWVVNIFITVYETRKGRELKSPILLADAAHTGSDVVVTAAVLLSLLAARFGVSWADPAGALIVMVVIGRVAWRIIASNLEVLLDRASVDAARVIAVVERHAQVQQCHRVRSRGPTGAVHVDLHILLDGDLPLRRAHEVAHEVEDMIKQALPEVIDVVIHTEPEEDGSEGL